MTIEENVYRRPNGRRLCLVCKREQQRAAAQRVRALSWAYTAPQEAS